MQDGINDAREIPSGDPTSTLERRPKRQKKGKLPGNDLHDESWATMLFFGPPFGGCDADRVWKSSFSIFRRSSHRSHKVDTRTTKARRSQNTTAKAIS